MASRRGFWHFVKNALLVATGGALLLGFIAYSEGAVTVYVHEKGPDSHRIWLPIPALAISQGLRFVSEDQLRDAMREARPWLPAIRVAAAELGKVPDGRLVEVRDGRDHVVVRKQGAYVLVSVDSDEDTVRLAIPLGTVQAVADRLEDSQIAAGGA